MPVLHNEHGETQESAFRGLTICLQSYLTHIYGECLIRIATAHLSAAIIRLYLTESDQKGTLALDEAVPGLELTFR